MYCGSHLVIDSSCGGEALHEVVPGSPVSIRRTDGNRADRTPWTHFTGRAEASCSRPNRRLGEGAIQGLIIMAIVGVYLNAALTGSRRGVQDSEDASQSTFLMIWKGPSNEKLKRFQATIFVIRLAFCSASDEQRRFFEYHICLSNVSHLFARSLHFTDISNAFRPPGDGRIPSCAGS